MVDLIGFLNDKLSKKVYQLDVFNEFSTQEPLSAFKLDEVIVGDFGDNAAGLRKYTNNNIGKMSIRRYMGMESWAACDYVLFKSKKNGNPVIFIIEKTDLYASALKIDKNSKVYKQLKKSIELGIAETVKLGIVEAASNGIKEICKYAKFITEKATDNILDEFTDKIIVDNLVNENNRKLHQSLLILLRLKNALGRLPDYEDIKDILMKDFEYHFIVFSSPNIGAKDGHNVVAINEQLENLLSKEMSESETYEKSKLNEEVQERITSMANNLRSDITNKGDSKVQPDNSIKLFFGEVISKPEELEEYLKEVQILQ